MHNPTTQPIAIHPKPKQTPKTTSNNPKLQPQNGTTIQKRLQSARVASGPRNGLRKRSAAATRWPEVARVVDAAARGAALYASPESSAAAICARTNDDPSSAAIRWKNRHGNATKARFRRFQGPRRMGAVGGLASALRRRMTVVTHTRIQSRLDSV